MIQRLIFATFSVFATTEFALSQDINTIAESWLHYTENCAQLYADHTSYRESLPPTNPGGSLTSTVSPDGRAISIHLDIGSGYIEAYIDVLSDRLVQHCAYYVDFFEWDPEAIASQYVQWVKLNNSFEIIGGLSPIDGYKHYRHTILGVWPSYDLEVQSEIHENEFQIFSTRVAK